MPPARPDAAIVIATAGLAVTVTVACASRGTSALL
jgi:hypothetical protein